jgi:hypothetical protein
MRGGCLVNRAASHFLAANDKSGPCLRRFHDLFKHDGQPLIAWLEIDAFSQTPKQGDGCDNRWPAS